MHALRPKGGGQDGPRKISSQNPQSGRWYKLQLWRRGGFFMIINKLHAKKSVLVNYPG